jgi:uncharacterized protein YbaR (Trm112 family)
VDPRCLPLLCDPDTHAPLELAGDALINPESGRRYLIRDGIRVFLQEVTGLNRKYQVMYDRLAWGYDFAERTYRWILKEAELSRRLHSGIGDPGRRARPRSVSRDGRESALYSKGY